MRSPITQVLPAGAVLLVTIDPPLTDREEPYVLTVRGTGSVVVQVVDSRQVSISNPTEKLSPFFFFVGPRSLALVPGWFQTVTRFLGGM
jgi:hypothetical protein